MQCACEFEKMFLVLLLTSSEAFFLCYVLFICFTFCFRDIPMPLVSSGVEHGNLRELALARMKDLGTQVNHNVFK